MRSYSFLGYVAIVFFAAAVAGGISPSRAAENATDKIILHQVRAIDPVTLQAEDTRVTLWGLRPVSAVETPFDLKALDLMDRLIGRDAVTCRIVSGTVPEITARCTVGTGEDLGLELLGHGYAVTDRRQAVNTVPAYAEAQAGARTNATGIWRLVGMDDKTSPAPQWLQLLMNWGPAGGLLLVALVMHLRLNRMENLQRDELEQVHHKESMLLTRERQVLISMLESELVENKNRIAAFLTIYGDVLKDMTATAAPPKYQRTGEIIQRHPSLSKTVFEANVGKLSLLDMKLAGQLSKLYMSLPKEQEYINIEPNVLPPTAVAVVEKVLREAEAMVPPIDQIISALDDVIAKDSV